MKNKKLFIIIDVLIAAVLMVSIGQYNSAHGDLAQADEFASAGDVDNLIYPYTKTFKISAYYSPLPCQDRYVTGSYDGDIRLNGGGVRGADGTPVYPGMIAAPRTYNFGVKMDIPDVGIVAIHDRGGAIVAAGGVGSYDRLDIWMGYGDKGLKRALNWGKRNVEVVVYGENDSLVEQIALSDYSEDEARPDQCGAPSTVIAEDTEAIVAPEATVATETTVTVITETTVTEPVADAESPSVAASPVPKVKAQPETVLTNSTYGLSVDLKAGDKGKRVAALQTELKNLNYFRTNITGYYGPLTEHAVFKFQQSQRLAGDKSSSGAGVFGPKTRGRLNQIVASRDYNRTLIAEASNDHKQNLIALADDED